MSFTESPSDSETKNSGAGAMTAEADPPETEKNELSHRNLWGAVFLVGQPLLLNAVSIPATAYIIRMLGETYYGDWTTAAALVWAVTTLATFGLRSIFVRSIAQNPEGAKAALGEQLSLRGLLSLCAGGIALSAAMILGYHDVILACVAITVLSLIFTTLGTAFGDVLQGFHRFKAFATVNLVSGLLLTVGSVLAVHRGYGPIGLAVAYMIGPLCSLIIFYLLIRRNFFQPSLKWNPSRFKRLLSDSRMVGTQGILSTVQSRFEQLVVPKMVGIPEMGYFSAGLMIADRLNMVPDGIATAFFPMISKSTAEDMEKARRQILFLIIVSLLMAVPLVLLTMTIAHPLSVFFFRRDPELCTQVIRITIWSLPLIALNYPLYTSLQACGKYSEASRRVMESTVFSTVLSLLLIWKFGLLGASWSWVARYAITVGFLCREFSKAYPGLFRQVPFFRIALSGGVMAGLLWAIQTLHESLLLTLTLGSVVATLAYVGALFAFRVIRPGELQALLRRSD